MSEKKKEKSLEKAKGGFARATSLTKEQRSEIAKKAANARWGDKFPEITHEGILNLAGFKIPCYVTADGDRVISGRGMQDALKLVDENVTYQKPGSRLIRLFGYKSLQPLITEANNSDKLEPIKCKYKGKVIHGYQAEVLADICDLMLNARSQGLLKTGRQNLIAEQCEILLRAFARVGITALVDEATGYQYSRARYALEEILEQFVAQELRKWVKTFPDEFYYHICRLKNWKYDEENKNKRGPIFGKLTNYLIYQRLAPGVLNELKRLTPKDSKGRHKQRLFQRLTEDIGNPRLRELLASEITVMRIFDDNDWDGFEKAINKALPIYGDLPLFDQYDMSQQNQLALLN